MIKHFESGVKGEMAVMSRVAEVVCIRKYDVMVGEGQLHFIFVNGENIAEDGSLKFLEKRAHAG